MGLNIGVISHNRSENIETLQHFPKSILRSTRLFIEPDDDLDTYEKNSCGVKVIQFKTKSKNTTHAKNRIIEYYKEQKERYLFIVDDDLTFHIRDGLTKGGYPKLRLCNEKEIEVMFKKLNKIIRIKNVSEVGLTYRQMNWLYKEQVEIGKRISAFMGVDTQEAGLFDDNCVVFDNHEMVLKLLTNNLLTVILSKWAMGTPKMAGNKGGMEIYHKREEFKKTASDTIDYLSKKYPTLVTSKQKKENDYVEPKEYWKRIKSKVLDNKQEYVEKIVDILNK